jgi:uncharacterized protein (TIGR02271 family)
MNGNAADPGADTASVTRHEEELFVAREPVEAGSVRVHRLVDTEAVAEHAETRAEHFDQAERVPVGENDSGQIETLEDGSISIPLLEEQLVVTKRLVVRERVIVRKQTVSEPHLIEAELRRERVAVDADAADPSSVIVDPSLETQPSMQKP